MHERFEYSCIRGQNFMPTWKLELEYEGTHFAIALNYDVLPKSRWAETTLKAGDEIEIITPRQGG